MIHDEVLPIGVKRNVDGTYYALICFTGAGHNVRLSDWDTPEEAFAEYKMMKGANIKIVAVNYKNKIPDRVYKALLAYEVKPY